MNDKQIMTSKNFEVWIGDYESRRDGVVRPIEYIRQPEVVIAVAITSANEVVLVRHSRPILGATLLECPGGKVDPGETREHAVQRELSEEVGLQPQRLEELGSFHTSVGTSTEKIYVYLATEMLEVPRKSEDVGRMTVVRLQFDEIHSLLREAILPDGKTQIALSWVFGLPAHPVVDTRRT